MQYIHDAVETTGKHVVIERNYAEINNKVWNGGGVR